MKKRQGSPNSRHGGTSQVMVPHQQKQEKKEEKWSQVQGGVSSAQIWEDTAKNKALYY